MKLHMDWLRIAEWACAGIFAVAVQSHNQDQFWISHQKLHRACVLDVFEKSQNKLVWSFLMFFVIQFWQNMDGSLIMAAR